MISSSKLIRIIPYIMLKVTKNIIILISLLVVFISILCSIQNTEKILACENNEYVYNSNSIFYTYFNSIVISSFVILSVVIMIENVMKAKSMTLS